MAGTVHGMVNKTFPRVSDHNSDYNKLQLMACMAQFLDHLSSPAGGSIMSKVANHYGGGSGWDYYGGGGSPIGDSAPGGVWKMNTSTLRPGGGSALGEIYIWLQCFGLGTSLEARDFCTSVGGMRVNNDIYATTRMGVQVCFREDGGNPWTGGTALAGADRPGNPWPTGAPWDAGASTLHFLLPRGCNPGGTYATNRNQMYNIFGNNSDMYDFALLEGYFHGIADDDNLVMIWTRTDALDSEPKDYQAFFLGLGELQPNCGSDAYTSYCWHDGNLPFGRGSNYGGVNCDGSETEGGVKEPRSGVEELQVSVFHAGLDQVRSPNKFSSTGLIYEEQGTYLYTADAWLGYGHEPGGDDFWRCIYGVPNESYDAVNKRAAFADQTTLNEKITVPWPDTIGEVPGATRTQAGVAF